MHLIAIFLARYLVFVIIIMAGDYWLLAKKPQKLRMAIVGGITAIIGLLLDKIGSHIFYDTRPFVVTHTAPLVQHSADNGFPSEHTLIAAVAAATLLSVSPAWGGAAVVLAVAVGIGRIAVHVHHTIDIAGSLVFVAIGYAIALYAAPRIVRRIYGKRTAALPKV
jgi:undecaprenyl-diphosphatase